MQSNHSYSSNYLSLSYQELSVICKYSSYIHSPSSPLVYYLASTVIYWSSIASFSGCLKGFFLICNSFEYRVWNIAMSKWALIHTLIHHFLRWNWWSFMFYLTIQYMYQKSILKPLLMFFQNSRIHNFYSV